MGVWCGGPDWRACERAAWMGRLWVCLVWSWVGLGFGQERQAEVPDPERLALGILEARRAGTVLRPLSQTEPRLDLPLAYRVQDELVRRWTEGGEEVAGFKAALTNPQVQQAFGVGEPLYGPLLRSMRIENGGQTEGASYRQLSVEVEIAFVLGERIEKPVPDLAGLRRLVKTVHPALELADNRFDSRAPKPKAVDLVAEGVGGAGFVLGEARAPEQVDLDALTGKLSREGVEVAQGPASGVLGGPWKALQWLVNAHTGRGRVLPAGAVVLSGSLGRPYQGQGETAWGQFVGDCGGLGRVSVKVAGERKER